MFKKQLFLFFVCIAFTGCQHMPTPTFNIKPSASETKLAEEKVKIEKEVNSLNEKIENLQTTKQQEFDKNISLASGSARAVYETMLAKPTKDNYDLAEMAGVEVVIDALPEPSFADFKRALDTQRKLISSLTKEVEIGKKEIEQQKEELKESKFIQQQAESEKFRLENEKSSIVSRFEMERNELQNKIVAEKNIVIGALQKVAENEAFKNNLIGWMVRFLTVIGAAMILIGFMMKSKLMLGAGVCAIVLALFSIHLPAWLFITAAATVFVLAIAAAVVKYLESKKVNNEIIGAVEEYKKENPEQYKVGLKKNLKEWTCGNERTENVIEETLKELNLK